MSPSFSSPTRRWLLIGVLLVAALLLASLADRSRRGDAPLAGGDFSACARLEGDQARACYRREVGRELAAVGGAPSTAFAAVPSGSGEVTFTAAAAEQQPLLCDLHARLGVVDAQVPSWLGWTASLAPQS